MSKGDGVGEVAAGVAGVAVAEEEDVDLRVIDGVGCGDERRGGGGLGGGRKNLRGRGFEKERENANRGESRDSSDGKKIEG